MLSGPLVLWFLLVVPGQSPAPALHIQVHSEFDYMARVRSFDQECWLAEKARRVVEGERVTITREDLGVTWRLTPSTRTYTESPRPPADTAASQPAAFDIHTAGWNWEPDYTWSVRESGQQATRLDRACREFVADGDADYAEAHVTFWACQPTQGTVVSPNDVVLARLRSDGARKIILETLASRGGLWVLQVEERQEPAIAPTLVIRARAVTLELASPPAGIFELPADAKKTEVTR